MKIETMPCVRGRQRGEVEVNDAEGRAFMSGQGHIQDAMPTTSAPIREQLLTGTHLKYWEDMMWEPDW